MSALPLWALNYTLLSIYYKDGGAFEFAQEDLVGMARNYHQSKRRSSLLPQVSMHHLSSLRCVQSIENTYQYPGYAQIYIATQQSPYIIWTPSDS
jgi:hypothetical protein